MLSLARRSNAPSCSQSRCASRDDEDPEQTRSFQSTLPASTPPPCRQKSCPVNNPTYAPWLVLGPATAVLEVPHVDIEEYFLVGERVACRIERIRWQPAEIAIGALKRSVSANHATSKLTFALRSRINVTRGLRPIVRVHSAVTRECPPDEVHHISMNQNIDYP